MAKTKRRRRTYTRRRGAGKGKRRAAALKGWRRKRVRRSNPRRRAHRRRRSNPVAVAPKRRRRRHNARPRSRRRRNARGWFRSRGGRSYGRRGHVRATKRGRRRYTRPVRRSTLRARARRRNPNGFIGDIMSMGTWQAAGSLAIGAVGSSALAGWLLKQTFVPEMLKTGVAARVASPLVTALAGALLGWGLSAAGMRNLGKSVATGGMVAAAVNVVTQVGQATGLFGDYVQLNDYVQLQGLGTQAQVEAGVFGHLGTQAQVEAGVFGHTEDEVSAQQTFGPTF